MRSFLFVTVLSSLVGCSSYRLVERTPDSATYAVYGLDPTETYADISPEVEAHCHGPVRVVHEGDVPVGEVTNVDNTQKRFRNGVSVGATQVRTATQTEWRVTYACDAKVPGDTARASSPIR